MCNQHRSGLEAHFRVSWCSFTVFQGLAKDYKDYCNNCMNCTLTYFVDKWTKTKLSKKTPVKFKLTTAPFDKIWHTSQLDLLFSSALGDFSILQKSSVRHSWQTFLEISLLKLLSCTQDLLFRFHKKYLHFIFTCNNRFPCHNHIAFIVCIIFKSNASSVPDLSNTILMRYCYWPNSIG